MQKKSAGSENLIGVGGSIKDVAAKIWGQLVVGLLSNFKNRILGGWLSPGCSIGSVGSLAIGTLEYCMEAGLSSCLSGGAGVEVCVVFTGTELASNLLPADCGVVSKALAGIALAVGLGISVCSTPCLYCSNK